MRFFRPTRIFVAALAALLGVAGWVGSAGWALRQDEATNPAEELARKVESDKVVLNFDEAHGYLRSVLKELKVPISSQTLVFSKSSFQLSQISPETPLSV